MKNKKKYYDLTAIEKIGDKKQVLTIGSILYAKLEDVRKILECSKKLYNNALDDLKSIPKDGEHSQLRHSSRQHIKAVYRVCQNNKQAYKAIRELYNKWLKFTQKNLENDNSVLMSLDGFEEVEGTPKERYYDDVDD